MKSVKSFYSTAESVLLICWINSNPEAEIRWYHKFSEDTTDEIDLSRQYLQENSQTHIWYIQTEQLNETQWKTSLFIKVNQQINNKR